MEISAEVVVVVVVEVEELLPLLLSAFLHSQLLRSQQSEYHLHCSNHASSASSSSRKVLRLFLCGASTRNGMYLCWKCHRVGPAHCRYGAQAADRTFQESSRHQARHSDHILMLITPSSLETRPAVEHY
ncbi:uncharacterized protein LOC121758259 isoform X1 [Salvia splendens]|uniref:uncharacterized protein LOC121758259 isoform X1 n=1 Tax=Salvia splendens TaxID=180675 RepID=UPI001C2683F8|nr:uncharacterized protein LOC121758259 isoform X1 [Salvia splendens]